VDRKKCLNLNAKSDSFLDTIYQTDSGRNCGSSRVGVVLSIRETSG
jgi:hypothetical protein